MNIQYTIEENVGILSERKNGWVKELNLIRWNGSDVKFDIREWSPDHEKMSKGITLSEDEIYKLYDLLKNYFHEETIKDINEDVKNITDIFLK